MKVDKLHNTFSILTTGHNLRQHNHKPPARDRPAPHPAILDQRGCVPGPVRVGLPAAGPAQPPVRPAATTDMYAVPACSVHSPVFLYL